MSNGNYGYPQQPGHGQGNQPPEWNQQEWNSQGWNQQGGWNGQPSASQPSASSWEQPPQQGWGQQSSGYPNGYQQYGAPGGQPPRKKSNLTPLIAGGVGLALIAAITTGVLVNRSRSGAETSTPASTSATPLPKAPGPGTYDSAKKLASDEGFKCTDEGVEGIKSTVCTHFSGAPYMVMYIGARPDGSLGRLSLEVQDNARATQSKALSGKVIRLFAPEDVAKDIETEIGKQETSTTSDLNNGIVNFRGNAKGSVVMWVKGWVPAEIKPNFIKMEPSKMNTILEGYGYKCATNGDYQQCDKTVDGVEYMTSHRSTESKEGLARLYLRTRSSDFTKGREAFQSEAKKILAALPDNQGDEIIDWMAKQPSNTGGLEFVDGRIVDYYPATTSEGKRGGALDLWETCWTGLRRYC